MANSDKDIIITPNRGQSNDPKIEFTGATVGSSSTITMVAVGKSDGEGGSGIVIIAYKGPQRGEGGTVSTTARPGYTTHTFTAHGEDTFIA